VDRVALGQVSMRLLRPYTLSIFQPMLYAHSLVYISTTVDSLYNFYNFHNLSNSQHI
jgi:hypothetical protein